MPCVGAAGVLIWWNTDDCSLDDILLDNFRSHQWGFHVFAQVII
jgi:hypothetical protein